MANLFELAAKLTLDSADYEKGIEAARRAAANFSRGLTAIVTATQNADSVVNAAADSAQEFSTQTSNAADSAEEFRQAESQVSRAAEESANSMSDAADEASGLTRELDRAESEFDDTEDAVDDYTESTDEAAKSTQKLGDEEEQTTKKTSTFGDTLRAVLTSDAIRAGLSAAWNGIQQIGRAFIDVGRQAVDAYGNYEQLAGGVETLFDNTENLERFKKAMKTMGYTAEQMQKQLAGYQDPIDIVMKNAANAYKTAGLSANAYMETVTSMAAALNQSTDDLELSARYADMAITDMSDNVNKMGSSMESIQNAYNGFSKANFTMLDNLKLGRHYCRAA